MSFKRTLSFAPILLHTLVFGSCFGGLGLGANAFASFGVERTDRKFTPEQAYELNNLVLIRLVGFVTVAYFASAAILVVARRSRSSRYRVTALLGCLCFVGAQLLAYVAEELGMASLVALPLGAALFSFRRNLAETQ